MKEFECELDIHFQWNSFCGDTHMRLAVSCRVILCPVLYISGLLAFSSFTAERLDAAHNRRQPKGSDERW